MSNSSLFYDTANHKLFIEEVLDRYDVLKGKRILIFYANIHGYKFDAWDQTKDNVGFVDLNLSREHFYDIDDHLNKNGP